MSHTLQIGDVTLPCREVVVEDQHYQVPKGVARNNRNKSWQVKVKRNGELKASGNFADITYGGTQAALDAAIQKIVESRDSEYLRTLKISDRTTLIWVISGKNILGMSALIYNPETQHASTVYLMSHRKVVEEKNQIDLAGKITGALVKEWDQENEGRIPAAKQIKLVEKVAGLIESAEWKKFLEAGAAIAAAREED